MSKTNPLEPNYKPPFITYEDLKEMEACQEHLDLFSRVFNPDLYRSGVPLSMPALVKAAEAELDIYWFMETFSQRFETDAWPNDPDPDQPIGLRSVDWQNLNQEIFSAVEIMKAEAYERNVVSKAELDLTAKHFTIPADMSQESFDSWHKSMSDDIWHKYQAELERVNGFRLGANIAATIVREQFRNLLSYYEARAVQAAKVELVEEVGTGLAHYIMDFTKDALKDTDV